MAASLMLALATIGDPLAGQSGPGSPPLRLDTSRPVTYWVAEGTPEVGSLEGDRALAEWALHAWAALAEPAIELAPSDEEHATLRVYWVPAGFGLYGEMRARSVDGRAAADVFIRPDTDGLGPDIAEAAARDPLLRETIVYLTCVHELGHAFGLGHTSAFADIMYSFQYGGDIVSYFGRFRSRIRTRADIPNASPFSRADARAFAERYGAASPPRRR